MQTVSLLDLFHFIWWSPAWVALLLMYSIL